MSKIFSVMKIVETEEQYEKALHLIEEFIIKVGDDQRYDNPDFVMLDRLSDLVTDYEDKHFKIETPVLLMLLN
jgi:HTH-type transcriptional regulator/antitoxin HigA